jgi:hypothetical protein
MIFDHGERVSASTDSSGILYRGVAKSLKYFAVKSENMLVTEAEAYQVSCHCGTSRMREGEE